MIILVHMLAGGATAVAVSQVTADPILPTLAGIASHFVLDAMPHLDVPPSAQDDEGELLAMTPQIWVQVAIDATLSALVVGFFWLTRYGYPDPHPLVLGALGGFLPDFVDNTPFWKDRIRRLPGFHQFHRFHQSTHDLWWRHFPMTRYAALGVVTQLIVTGLSLAYLLRA